MVSWGRGEDGQLGHGDATERHRPQVVFGLMGRRISSVHCGAEYSIAVSREELQTYSWGWGDFGRLGHGDCIDVFVPAPIAALEGVAVAAVSCGDTHTLVASCDGGLLAFGRGQNGQLGGGGTDDCLAPTAVEALKGQRVVAVACGAEHSVCATSDGAVYAWGWGRYGNLGDGESLDRHVPTRVRGLEGVAIEKVACGWRHSAAVDGQGRLYVWGWGKYGQLGHGDFSDQLVPKQVEALAGVKVRTVAGGWRHTLALDTDGGVWAWGWNKFGQLGLGGSEDANSPARVGGAMAAAKGRLLASGWKHSLAVDEAGACYAWGRGVNGQLGRGDVCDQEAPAVLEALSVGSMDVEALVKEAHPVVMQSVPQADRYAVVPDSTGGDAGAQSYAVPEAKRHKG